MTLYLSVLLLLVLVSLFSVMKLFIVTLQMFHIPIPHQIKQIFDGDFTRQD